MLCMIFIGPNESMQSRGFFFTSLKLTLHWNNINMLIKKKITYQVFLCNTCKQTITPLNFNKKTPKTPLLQNKHVVFFFQKEGGGGWGVPKHLDTQNKKKAKREKERAMGRIWLFCQTSTPCIKGGLSLLSEKKWRGFHWYYMSSNYCFQDAHHY